MPEPRRSPVAVFFAMIAALVVPAALTLRTVREPREMVPMVGDPSPYGYTWSLLLFIVPLVALAWWYRGYPTPSFQRRAFRVSLVVLLVLGFGLDILFAHTFFTFENKDAVLGLWVPVVGGSVPVEEFVFYLTGFLLVLLLYLWGDEYWLAAYNVEDYELRSKHLPKLVGFHWPSVITGVVILVLALIYKKFFSSVPEGFPGYLTFLVLTAVVPAAGFFERVRDFINWRAFALTFFLMLLVSLLWEATLAAPYQWWGYHPEMMTGLFVNAWCDLPVEAVLVWFAVTFTTVIIYEVIKIFFATGKSAREAFFG